MVPCILCLILNDLVVVFQDQGIADAASAYDLSLIAFSIVVVLAKYSHKVNGDVIPGFRPSNDKGHLHILPTTPISV